MLFNLFVPLWGGRTIVSHLHLVFRFKNLLNAIKFYSSPGSLQFRQAKTEIVSASKVAYRFLLGVTNNVTSSPDSTGNTNRGSPRIQAAWFKNMITTGARPSSSSEIENQEEDALRQNRPSDAELPLQQNSLQRSVSRSDI